MNDFIVLNKVRETWINLFSNHGYFFLEPASLIPSEDDSLLWINSGVATLKKYFRNPKLLPFSDIVNCQPVIRTDDSSQIVDNTYHQTLFEMLGIFSIGGKFKEEVIPLISQWFLNKEWLNIPINLLYITVWKDDQLSYELWLKQSFSKEHILFGDKTTNFWDMGDGPCGANSEIYFDLQPEKKCPTKIEDLNSSRFIELGNLVFPEFYHQNDEYLPLDKKCVDVGIGLERVVMVLQNKKNTFEIDIWKPILEQLNELVGNK